MPQVRCSVCGYIYDEEAGEPSTKTGPDTPFEELPDEWRCPVCAAEKSAFSPVSTSAESGPALSMVWRCTVCNYRYNEENGEAATNTPLYTLIQNCTEGSFVFDHLNLYYSLLVYKYI
jgi:rubredoxin